jgi:hypothetical protein
MKTQKPILPASASALPPESQGSHFSNRRVCKPSSAICNGVYRLFFMDGLAPGSRFSWLEVQHG